MRVPIGSGGPRQQRTGLAAIPTEERAESMLGVQEDFDARERVHSGRPSAVQGPYGPITRESLPPSGTLRWVVRRKAEVLAAIDGGLITAEEACLTYRLSHEELDLWREAIERAGVPGLRVTRIQLYRDLDIHRRGGASGAQTPLRLPGFARQA